MRTETDQLSADLTLESRDGAYGNDHHSQAQCDADDGYPQNGACNGILTAGINRQAIGYE